MNFEPKPNVLTSKHSPVFILSEVEGGGRGIIMTTL